MLISRSYCRQKISTLSGHIDTVHCVKAVSSLRAISSSRDSTIQIWNIVTGKCHRVLEGHTKTVRTLAVCDDKVVSGSYDRTARAWSLEKDECTFVMRGHENQIYSVVCDKKIVVTAGVGEDVRIWDVNSGYVCLKFPSWAFKFFCLLRFLLLTTFRSLLTVLKVPTTVVTCLNSCLLYLSLVM